MQIDKDILHQRFQSRIKSAMKAKLTPEEKVEIAKGKWSSLGRERLVEAVENGEFETPNGEKLYLMGQPIINGVKIPKSYREMWASCHNIAIMKGYGQREAGSFATIFVKDRMLDEGLWDDLSEGDHYEKEGRDKVRKDREGKYGKTARKEGVGDIPRDLLQEFDAVSENYRSLSADEDQVIDTKSIAERAVRRAMAKKKSKAKQTKQTDGTSDEYTFIDVKGIARRALAIRKAKAKNKGKKAPAYMNPPANDKHPVIDDQDGEGNVRKVAKRTAQKVMSRRTKDDDYGGYDDSSAMHDFENDTPTGQGKGKVLALTSDEDWLLAAPRNEYDRQDLQKIMRDYGTPDREINKYIYQDLVKDVKNELGTEEWTFGTTVEDLVVLTGTWKY